MRWRGEGGRKNIEKALGLSRPIDVRGLDGWDAVRLWREGRPSSLRRLLLYNAFDVLQLEPLLRCACNEWAGRLGMPAERFDLERSVPAEAVAREAAGKFIPRR